MLAHKNGVDIGNINHSKEFPRLFLKSVYETYKTKMVNYLSTAFPSTGHPPINIIADKATYKHRTRQFVAPTTITPGCPQFVQSVFLDVPPVKRHDRPGVTESIIEVLDDFNVVSKQICGQSCDGAYFHLGVPVMLSKHYKKGNKSCIAMHDPLHSAGLVDSHIRDNGQVEWLVSITSKCGSVLAISIGVKAMNYFYRSVKKIDVKLYDPKSFSATRFAITVFTTVLDMTTQLLLSH